MRIHGHDIGVCSWSLQTKEAGELVGKIKELGLAHVQLAMGKLTDEQLRANVGEIRAAGIEITAGMIGFAGEDYASIAIIRKTGGYLPDELWPERQKESERVARLGKELGIQKISTHIGFVPPSSDPRYKVMVERVGQVADAFGQEGVELLMETGQEQAPELLQFLNDLSRRNVCINFDPANMILYGAGDPIEAIHTLGRHIGHVHVKDATLSSQPAVTWGAEVPFGTGAVPHGAFLEALAEVKYGGPLVIEREAGQSRMADVKVAIETLERIGTEAL
ncbi:MAG TPA: sugar phosphate isomerase/epimerase family protein [Tepidisphaeraceae bacterium]|jgi:sugar phosphate isomerase/epimerase|nr:sugar phosphate isomerase/epimerase family protein [Tepidisphaeraceae bacterium]